MTVTIRQLADAFATASRFVVGGPSKVYRHFNATLNISVVVFIGEVEPTRILPLNTLWIDMDKTSDTYKKFLRRTSKVPSDGRNNTWEVVTEINSLWAAQYYDATDGTPSVGSVGRATTVEFGLAKLSYPAAQEPAPVFVSENDERLTDKRVPLPHDEMHPEKPMVSVIGVVTVNAGAHDNGATLVADNAATSTQRKLKRSEITG